MSSRRVFLSYLTPTQKQLRNPERLAQESFTFLIRCRSWPTKTLANVPCSTEGPTDNGSDTTETAESTSCGGWIAVAVLFILLSIVLLTMSIILIIIIRRLTVKLKEPQQGMYTYRPVATKLDPLNLFVMPKLVIYTQNWSTMDHFW